MELIHKLPRTFYTQAQVTDISKALLGKFLCTRIGGALCTGIIVETEAYCGACDRACHAYGGRRTPRTEVIYGEGGFAYTYLCYGIHVLFNIVTNVSNCADVVLIRALQPVEGLDIMLARRGMQKPAPRLSAGPGALTQAMGIGLAHYGTDLSGDVIWLEDRGLLVEEAQIQASPRVNIAYAGQDAALPWRFRIKNNPWTSPAK